MTLGAAAAATPVLRARTFLCKCHGLDMRLCFDYEMLLLLRVFLNKQFYLNFYAVNGLFNTAAEPTRPGRAGRALCTWRSYTRTRCWDGFLNRGGECGAPQSCRWIDHQIPAELSFTSKKECGTGHFPGPGSVGIALVVLLACWNEAIPKREPPPPRDPPPLQMKRPAHRTASHCAELCRHVKQTRASEPLI